MEELTNRLRNGEAIDKKIAIDILKRIWNPKGFESKLQEKQDLEDITEILDNFLIDISDAKGEILDSEKDFTLEIDDYLIKGRIDRIDSDGNDFVIIDYKTTKETSGPKKAVEDLQLVLYSLAVESIYSKKPNLVGWWFLRKNKKVMVQISQDGIEKVKAKMTQRLALESETLFNNRNKVKESVAMNWRCQIRCLIHYTNKKKKRRSAVERSL